MLYTVTSFFFTRNFLHPIIKGLHQCKIHTGLAKRIASFSQRNSLKRSSTLSTNICLCLHSEHKRPWTDCHEIQHLLWQGPYAATPMTRPICGKMLLQIHKIFEIIPPLPSPYQTQTSRVKFSSETTPKSRVIHTQNDRSELVQNYMTYFYLIFSNIPESQIFFHFTFYTKHKFLLIYIFFLFYYHRRNNRWPPKIHFATLFDTFKIFFSHTLMLSYNRYCQKFHKEYFLQILPFVGCLSLCQENLVMCLL